MSEISAGVSHLSDELIQTIYLVGADLRGWKDFLERLKSAIGASWAGVAFVDTKHFHVQVSAVAGWTDVTTRAYLDGYASQDPYVHAARAKGMWRTGVVALGNDLLPVEEFQATKFYKEFGRYHSYAGGGIAAVIVAENEVFGILSACPTGEKAFGQAEVALFRQLLPHLQTALYIRRELLTQSAIGRGALATLDRLSFPVFLCDAHSRVVHRNRAASATVSGEALCVERGFLSCANAHQTARLRRMIETIGRPDHQDEELSRQMWLPTASGRIRIVIASVTTADSFLPSSYLVAVCAIDPQYVPVDALDALRAAFALTKAEARVGVVLLRGESVEAIARALSVSQHTVRSHLKQLFAKTNTSRQAALIRVLLTALAA